MCCRKDDLKRRMLLGGFRSGLEMPGIQLIQMGLKPFLGLIGQAREFDAHADAAIVGANGGVEVVRS